MAAFQQAYGIDLTREKVHWFRFRALFAALPEETLMAKIMSWRTMDLSEYEGSMRDRYADLQERFALPAELREGCRPCRFGRRARCRVPCAVPALAAPRCPALSAGGRCRCGQSRTPQLAGVWVKCKNPACKREVEIKL